MHMKLLKYCVYISIFSIILGCNQQPKPLMADIYETSASGNKLTKITEFSSTEKSVTIKLLPDSTFQTITGFGGAFTESSAYLLNKLSIENRAKILEAYFGMAGANYSLTRTHMNSCDFALSQYSYAPVEKDVNLEHFTSKTNIV